MKNLKFNKTMFTKLVALLIIFSAVACSSDDSEPVLAPSTTVTNTELTTPFFTEGETDAPTINWNGNVGLFSLGSNITGVSVDATTGIISWDKSLPLGTNTIQLIAINSAGQVSTDIILENQFSGNFDGAYNTDPSSTDVDLNFELNFNLDGTMEAKTSETNIAIGTWTKSGNTITSVYSYNDGASFFTVVTDLTYSSTEATITGLWSGGETLADPARGYTKLTHE